MSQRVNRSIKDYLMKFNINGCVGVTLTMKKSSGGEKLDNIRCSRNLRHCLNRVNKNVYGKSFDRYGKRLRVLPVLESKKGRFHYHLLIEKPTSLPYEQFCKLMQDCWMKTKFGNRQVHFHQNINHGWSGYITKFQNVEDEPDWENLSGIAG